MQVKDELKRYMDALLAKSRAVTRMIEQLNEPYNPKPTEGTIKQLDSTYLYMHSLISQVG